MFSSFHKRSSYKKLKKKGRKLEKVYWKMCDRNQLAFNVHGHNCHVLHVVALSTVDMRLYLNDSLSIKT